MYDFTSSLCSVYLGRSLPPHLAPDSSAPPGTPSDHSHSAALPIPAKRNLVYSGGHSLLPGVCLQVCVPLPLPLPLVASRERRWSIPGCAIQPPCVSAVSAPSLPHLFSADPRFSTRISDLLVYRKGGGGSMARWGGGLTLPSLDSFLLRPRFASSL